MLQLLLRRKDLIHLPLEALGLRLVLLGGGRGGLCFRLERVALVHERLASSTVDPSGDRSQGFDLRISGGAAVCAAARAHSFDLGVPGGGGGGSARDPSAHELECDCGDICGHERVQVGRDTDSLPVDCHYAITIAQLPTAHCRCVLSNDCQHTRIALEENTESEAFVRGPLERHAQHVRRSLRSHSPC